jgi:hypothetical protein
MSEMGHRLGRGRGGGDFVTCMAIYFATGWLDGGITNIGSGRRLPLA